MKLLFAIALLSLPITRLSAEEMFTRDYNIATVQAFMFPEQALTVSQPDNDPFGERENTPPLFVANLKEVLEQNSPLRFPEGSWIRPLGNTRSLRMHNSAENHAWLRHCLLSAMALETRIHIQTELRAFAAEDVEALERQHGGGLPDEVYLRLRREGRGETIHALSTVVEPTRNVVTRHGSLLRYPLPNDDDNDPVELEERHLGFTLNVTAMVELAGQIHLVLCPEYNQLLAKPASAFPKLDALTPLVRSWNVTTTFSLWTGETLVAAETTSREDGRRWVYFVSATITDLEGSPISPPDVQRGGMETRLYPTGRDGGFRSVMYLDSTYLSEAGLAIPDLYVLQASRFAPMSEEDIRPYLRHRLGMDFPEGSRVQEFPQLGFVLLHTTPGEHKKFPKNFVYRSEFPDPLDVRLHVLSFDANAIEALERTRTHALQPSDWIELWQKGKGKTEWVQRIKTANGVNVILKHVEEHMFPTEEAAAVDGQAERRFLDIETLETGFVLDFTSTMQLGRTHTALVLLPSWTERDPDHEGNPLSPVFRKETLSTTVMADLGKPNLIRQNLSADGSRRFVWLIQANMED